MQDNSCSIVVIHEAEVKAAKKALPKSALLDKASDFFKLLGEPGRLSTLKALESRELCVCDLAAVLGMSSSAVSHQLRLLKEGRLVKSRREGKVVYYRLHDEHVTTILKQGLEHAGDKE